MKILLCRHTQTDDNRDRIFSGQNNAPLNETGWQQAQTLTDTIMQLVHPPIGAVLSSDLLRAVSLAELIGERAGVTPILDPALREVHIGQMAGLRREDALSRFPLERHKTASPNFDYTDIGGESAEGVRQRHLNFLGREIQQLEMQGVQNVVVVGHGTSLRLVFQYTLRLIDNLHRQGEHQGVFWRRP